MATDYYDNVIQKDAEVTYIQPYRRLQYEIRQGTVVGINGDHITIKSHDTGKTIDRSGKQVIVCS